MRTRPTLRTVLLCLLCSVAMVHVQAKIGETRFSIEGRLGFPVAKDGNLSLYQRKGFTIIVTYQNGVSVMEEISKSITLHKPASAYEQAVAAKPGGDLSQTELAALLDVYGDGKGWEQPAALDQSRKRADGKVVAIHKDHPRPHFPASFEDEMAMSETPSLVIADAVYLASLDKQESEAKNSSAAHRKEEANQVQSVFGPATPGKP